MKFAHIAIVISFTLSISMKSNVTQEKDLIKVKIKSVENPSDLFSDMDRLLNNYLEEHCIADVTEIKINEALSREINKLFDKHRSSRRSLIFITKIEDLSYFDEHAPVVPTEQEARDFLEMEEIERKLLDSEEE